MSHELRALADQLCKEDFRCLSPGIGIFTRPKRARVPLKRTEQQASNKDKVNQAPNTLPIKFGDNGNVKVSRLQRDLNSDKSSLRKKNSSVKKSQSFSRWIFNKALAWSLDLGFVLLSVSLVVLIYSFTKGSFDLNQRQWILGIVDGFLEQMSFVFLGLGTVLLLLMYGLLFRLIVGATLGEAIISRFLVSAKSQKNKRLYNNFI